MNDQAKYGVQPDRLQARYTAPLKKEWVGLTDDERVAILWDTDTNIDYAKAIEAKLKEKNSG